MWESLVNGLGGLKGIGTILGAGLQGYSAYQQSKMMRELLNMQKKDRLDEKNRKKRTQARLDLAFDKEFDNNSPHKYNNANVPLY